MQLHMSTPRSVSTKHVSTIISMFLHYNITIMSFVTTEATGQEASSERNSLDDDDVERNADLYIVNHEVAQR